ncbi:d573b7de-738c-4b9f-b51c-af534f1a4e5a [Sclerotinia trifoliorum]|uniref:D573b7de-738c-4b9f-b51c-af534f1a4e5a n=1 Tax=Sclerotinia trifoliorum TaxID=28548 RepID=A0A8H2VM89_9HELO|nr:d573b7de-738c-4b9f-b51c-af534f1a4e5a [Sclerotinia trifoliorum]
MPVVTRSKSKRCLSSLPKDVKLYLPKASSSDDPLQNLVVYPKCRQNQSKHQSRQQPRKKSQKYQNSSQEKPPGGSTNIHLPNLSSTTITHWPCRACGCPQGVFELFVPICVNCGHDMDNHELQDFVGFNPFCDFICERQELVSSVLQQALTMGMVVIRATPVVGKTTLLKLLGRHILFHRRELEPIYITWQPRNERNNLPYQQVLDEGAVSAQVANARLRPHNPNAKRIFLIDEAQGSYEEDAFWNHDLKNHLTRSRPIFVLACLYSPASIFGSEGQRIESRASKLDTLNRIELRPSKSNSLGMLFKPEETLTKVSKWILQKNLKPESVDHIALAEYIHSATNGHPGMVGLILASFELLTSQNAENRPGWRWSPAFVHEYLIEHDTLLRFLSQWGRGFWTAAGENHLKRCLRGDPSYRHLKYSDIADAMRKVARLPKGCTEIRTDPITALAFCHKMGFLYAEEFRPGSGVTTYIFASPIHQRIAYRRLIPAPPLGTNIDQITLRKACLNAIERFSPSVLRHRVPLSNSSFQSNDKWGIPEAAFQDEMYCCLNYELHNLPILSEYAETKDGRIDFYIFDKRWGVEILQSGNNGRLEEHANRFRYGGKYHRWGIFEDYIILNFCSKSSIDTLQVKDIDIQKHILHIVIDANDCTAEVYTYNKQLQETLALGEGRVRSYSAEPGSASEDFDVYMTLRDQEIELEQEKTERVREKQEMVREKQEMERKIIQLQLQLNQR